MKTTEIEKVIVESNIPKNIGEIIIRMLDERNELFCSLEGCTGVLLDTEGRIYRAEDMVYLVEGEEVPDSKVQEKYK